MTAGKNDQDPVRAFRAALPSHIGAQLHPTERTVVFIHAAVARGWTIPALVAEATRSLGGVVNPGGVITSRLEHCAEHDPPAPTGPVTFVQPMAWCGRCDDPHTRYVMDAEGRITGRCPDCWTDPRVAESGPT